MKGSVASAVLFASDEGEEALRIECAVTPAGELLLHQESDGDVTWWCFEETPHIMDVVVPASETRRLAELFVLDEVDQLPQTLAAEYVGYESSIELREMLRRQGISYEVVEHLPRR